MYGQDADKNLLEEAVRWVIITIIFVFDPLAVLLLIAANFSLKQRYGWDFESFADKQKKVEPQPTEVPKATGLKVGTAIISSRKKDPKVVVKEVESSLDVNKPQDVKELEQKVKQKIEGNSNSSFLDE
jgi:GTP:adenosylcobinamide-phosphate guanylyltransferase